MRQEAFEDIDIINIDWSRLEGKKVLITGGTGLVGYGIARYLLHRNEKFNSGIDVNVMARDESCIREKFSEFLGSPSFTYMCQDIRDTLSDEYKADYIIHAAGKGAPAFFVKNPLEILDVSYTGTKNVLDYAGRVHAEKVVYISSGEVYGILKDTETKAAGSRIKEYGMTEDQCANIDILKSRSCYAVGKAMAENLCVCYGEKNDVNVNIARLCHTYGADILADESRVIFQFMRNVLNGEDVVLKSEGLQKRSYCHINDVVKGIMYILLYGSRGEAYNVSNRESVVSIRELAELIAGIKNKRVVYGQQSIEEKSGNSNIEFAVLNSEKLERLGYRPTIGLNEGLKEVIRIRELSN